MLYCAAKMDENNKVIDTLAVDETDIVDSNGNISDELTTSFANSIRQTTGTWKAAGMFQEGTVPSFRKTQPGIGDNWEPEQQKFYQKQPHSSWVLDSNLDWNSPTPKPTLANQAGILFFLYKSVYFRPPFRISRKSGNPFKKLL